MPINSKVGTPLEELIELDKKLLWHPYTSMSDPTPHYLVGKAQDMKHSLSGWASTY